MHMEALQASVRAFHERHQFFVGRSLTEEASRHDDDLLNAFARDLLELSRAAIKAFEKGMDPRLIRAHLLLEELGELLEALAGRDEAKALDGLADLVYVAAGTAVAFELPLSAALLEVCRSNDTKLPMHGYEANGQRTSHPKGPGYSPPDIAGVLERHRRLMGNSP